MKLKQIFEAKYASQSIVVHCPADTYGLYLYNDYLYNADKLRETYQNFDEDGVGTNDPEVEYENYMILAGNDSARLTPIDTGMAATEIWDPDEFSYEGPIKQGQHPPLFVIPHKEFDKAIKLKWLVIQ